LIQNRYFLTAGTIPVGSVSKWVP